MNIYTKAEIINFVCYGHVLNFDIPKTTLVSFGYGIALWIKITFKGRYTKSTKTSLPLFGLFFQLFYFNGHFSHFWALGGPLRVTRNSGGPPRAPMSSLTSRDTHPPGLVLLLVQLGKFADFWGRLCTLQFQCCDNHHHCHRGRGGGGRSAICSQRPQIFSTLSQKLNFT